MGERWFLKLDGIPGESTASGHKNEIDVDSWSWGLSQSGAGHRGGGTGAGKASFENFQFVTRISKASPALFRACASGTHIKEASLVGRRSIAKGTGPEVLHFKFYDLLVSSVMQGGGPDDGPGEQFSMNFSKVEFSYTPQSSSGKTQPPVTAGWDIKTNKSF